LTLRGPLCRSVPVVTEAITSPVWSGGKRIPQHRGRQPVGQAGNEAARSSGPTQRGEDRADDRAANGPADCRAWFAPQVPRVPRGQFLCQKTTC